MHVCLTAFIGVLILLTSTSTAFAFPKKLPKLKGVKPKVVTPQVPAARTPGIPAAASRPLTQAVVQATPQNTLAVPASVAQPSAPETTAAHFPTLAPPPAAPVPGDLSSRTPAPRKTAQQVLAELELFIQENNRFPLQGATDPVERALRAGVDNHIRRAKNPQDPTILRLIALRQQFRGRAEAKTPQQVLADLERFIQENNRFPSATANPSTAEYSLRRGVDRAISNTKNPQAPTILRLTALKSQWVKEIHDSRTPEQILADLENFIEQNGRFPDQRAEDPAERSLRAAIDNATRRAKNPQDPTILRLLELKEQCRKMAEAQAPAQLVADLEQFIQEHNRFPSEDAPDPAERSLRSAFNRAVRTAKDLQDPVSLQLMAFKKQWVREIAEARTPAQLVADLERFIQEHNRFPSPTAQDSVEASLRIALNNTLKNAKNLQDPSIVRLTALKNQWVKKIAEARTPEQVLEELELFISENNRFPSQTTQNPSERSLRSAVSWAITNAKNPQDPTIVQLTALKKQWVKPKAQNRTAEEYVALAQQYETKPRFKIYRNGHWLSRGEMTPDELQETSIGIGLNGHRNHPLVRAYLQQNRVKAEQQTTEQLYTALVALIQEYGHYPSTKENSLYDTLRHRFRYYQSARTPDGKYQDPWLQKIYELKTALQNAPEGKFTLTPDGQGGYILEIESPAEEDISAPQAVEEIAPVAPSAHTIRLRITEKTKNLIESVRNNAALERREFYPWLMSMKQPDKFAQIVNKNTMDALFTLSRAIAFDYQHRQNRHQVTNLLYTVNNYVGILGEQENGIFYKLIYRGQTNPSMLPAADDFHVVAEEQGLSWDGELAPQVEKANRLHILAARQNTPYSVYLDGDEEMVTALGIEPSVPASTVQYDLETTLTYLLPPGYTVRMGLHELGVVGNDVTKFRRGYLHLHLENTATSEFDEGMQIDHSISLDVKAGRFAGRYDYATRSYKAFTDQQIAQNYLLLFDKFLDDDARNFLENLAGGTR